MVSNVYKCKKKILQGACRKRFQPNQKIFLYDLHDGKMLYMLTQHSLYNRKCHPYLLCKCGPGDAVRDPDHVCVPINQDKQVERWERSKNKYAQFMTINEQKSPPSQYTESDHRNWADMHNYGITHYGVHPCELRRDNIRFDVFTLDVH